MPPNPSAERQTGGDNDQPRSNRSETLPNVPQSPNGSVKPAGNSISLSGQPWPQDIRSQCARPGDSMRHRPGLRMPPATNRRTREIKRSDVSLGEASKRSPGRPVLRNIDLRPPALCCPLRRGRPEPCGFLTAGTERTGWTKSGARSPLIARRHRWNDRLKAEGCG